MVLLTGGVLLLAALYFFGATTPPASAKEKTPVDQQGNTVLSTQSVIDSAKLHISDEQLTVVTQLENSVVRGNVQEQQIRIYHQLADYWRDSLGHRAIGAFYLGEAAKLEKSEKNLNFAAHLMLEMLIGESDPAAQTWLANTAKPLLEQALQINPANDSAKIDLGACYIFGNISSTPMEGITKIKEVVDRDPENMYGQLILGLGDIKSAQYDKAIERLQIVAEHEPGNLLAIFNLAETFERKGDNANAAKWYREAAAQIDEPAIKQEIEKRIQSLQ